MAGKVIFSSRWRDVMPNGHYVYIHTKMSNGDPFYVGKGSLKRAWSPHGRNVFWKRISQKHGVDVKIIRDGMNELCAKSLEKIVIGCLRIDGLRLSNMSDGGEGSKGYVSPLRKTIYSSEGEVFTCTDDAIKFLRANGYKTASKGNISSCINGNQGFAYGRCWSRSPNPERPKFKTQGEAAAHNFRSKLSVPVVSDVHGEFKSIQEAIRFLKANGWNRARASNISQVCLGRRKIAYGSAWRYNEV